MAMFENIYFYLQIIWIPLYHTAFANYWIIQFHILFSILFLASVITEYFHLLPERHYCLKVFCSIPRFSDTNQLFHFSHLLFIFLFF